MNNDKIDDQLNFAMQIPKEVLLTDENLQNGYDSSDNTWELIVRYNGDISSIAKELDIIVEELSYGYAIVVLKENVIDRFSNYSQIEYIEKPRRLYFAIDEAKMVSCINYVQRNEVAGLFGEGVICAIIDSGIDYSHNDFRNEDGSTRILRLWDQTINEKPPKGYFIGSEYTADEINQALQEEGDERYRIVPSKDYTGHGTFVAGVCCGNGRESQGRYKGVASRSNIVVVKIGDSIGDSFPSTTRLLEALDYVVKLAIEYNMPVAINLSFGNNYGEHNGRSILEQYIDNIASTWKNSVCIGTGNEGISRKHASGILGQDISNIELVVDMSEPYISMQLWKNYKDEFDISIISPSGTSIGVRENINSTMEYKLGEATVYIYYGTPTPISTYQEINIIVYANNEFVENGIWTLKLTPQNITDGRYDIWLGSLFRLNEGTGFIEADTYGTLTIPSTSYRAISVGAYDGRNDSYATFSGRGFLNYSYILKPDIVAPGVGVTSTSRNGGYETRTGTSMATPIVTGSAALMLEWGIIRGNDMYLYGEKIKAYLIKGARPLREFRNYPNPVVGWGALCLRDSLPMI